METNKAIYQICIYCKKEKPLWEYRVDNKNSTGVKDCCKECKTVYENHIQLENQKQIEIRKVNRKIQLEYTRKRKKALKEVEKEIKRIKLLEYREERKRTAKEREKKRNKIYRDKNRDKINKVTREYVAKRKKEDPLYKLKIDVRRMIYNAHKSKGYKKRLRSFEILGCSGEEFKLHIEKQFESWMTWQNHGQYNYKKNSRWHLDHIIPLASAKTPEDVIRLNHFTNFQPLCSYINQVTKRDKLNYKHNS